MDSSATRLVASGISVRFGGLHALSQVDLDVDEGEIVGLIGSNGAGKSTMVNVLSGFQRPSDGHVVYRGRRLEELKPHKVARAGIVRTFQSVRLFRDLSVFDNVAAAAAVLGKAAPAVAELIKMMGLTDLSEKLAGGLSYAHQRKLAIARALALRPRILLLDEPAAGMAADEASEMRHVLVGLRDQTGMGLLLIEHNMMLVMAACERLIVVDGGRVIARGTPEEVRRDPLVRNAYLGESTTGAE